MPRSVQVAMRDMVSTASTGCSPAAVSPERHDGAGAVVDGVGHVGNLRAGGAHVVDHAFEHLRGGDDALAQHAALGDELFLYLRQFLEGYLHAHVAAADHDAVAGFTDLLDVVNAGAVFQLGDDVDVLGAQFVEPGVNGLEVFAAGDKGTGDEVTSFSTPKRMSSLSCSLK